MTDDRSLEPWSIALPAPPEPHVVALLATLGFGWHVDADAPSECPCGSKHNGDCRDVRVGDLA